MFATVFPGVLGRERHASENPFCIREIDAVFAQVEPALALIPDERDVM